MAKALYDLNFINDAVTDIVMETGCIPKYILMSTDVYRRFKKSFYPMEMWNKNGKKIKMPKEKRYDVSSVHLSKASLDILKVSNKKNFMEII